MFLYKLTFLIGDWAMKPATLGCFPSAKQASEYLDDERKEEVISKARSEESRQYLWINWLNWQILVQIKSRSDRIVSEVYLLGQPFAYFWSGWAAFTCFPLLPFFLVAKYTYLAKLKYTESLGSQIQANLPSRCDISFFLYQKEGSLTWRKS